MKIFTVFYDLTATRFLVVAGCQAEARSLLLDHLQRPHAYLEFEGMYELPGYAGLPMVLQETK